MLALHNFNHNTKRNEGQHGQVAPFRIRPDPNEIWEQKEGLDIGNVYAVYRIT